MVCQEKLLHVYLCILLSGFICTFLATILPYWFAKYPSANTRFLRLGLWEICFEDFVSPLEQQRFYSGCFYIFDSKIRPLWPLVFAAWFHAAQALQILNMIVYTVLFGCGLAMLLNVLDKQRPKTVLSSIYLSIVVIWISVTVLGLVGINVDLEKKQTRARGVDTWLAETDQSNLSWSYGLEAFALLFTLIALNILVWCVYPRKERGGKLLKEAWNCPTEDDLPCCFSRRPYREMAVQEASTMRRSTGSLRSQRAIDHIERQRLQQMEHQQHQQTQRVDVSENGDVSSVDVVTYDPRSADIVSEQGPSSFATDRQPLAGDAYINETIIPKHDPRIYVEPSFNRASSRLSSVRSANEVAQVARSMRASGKRLTRFKIPSEPATDNSQVIPKIRTISRSVVIMFLLMETSEMVL
uniref:Conserved plasma membrane protein n=2 Tax=Mesocestoides corti TaxID=53468 RepID=A0A5K3FCQ7_MESCO